MDEFGFSKVRDDGFYCFFFFYGFYCSKNETKYMESLEKR